MTYPEAREEAKRLTRALGHQPRRFEAVGQGYETRCRLCGVTIGVTDFCPPGWKPYGLGTKKQCTGEKQDG